MDPIQYKHTGCMYRMYRNHTVPHIAPIEKMQSPQGKDDAFENKYPSPSLLRDVCFGGFEQ